MSRSSSTTPTATRSARGRGRGGNARPAATRRTTCSARCPARPVTARAGPEQPPATAGARSEPLRKEEPMSINIQVIDALDEAEAALRKAAQAVAEVENYDAADNETARRVRRLREDIGELRDRVEEVGVE